MAEYEVGQELKIGYYGGFHRRELIKANAKVIKIVHELIHIHVEIWPGESAYKTMFGYASDLKKLEANYYL